MIKKYFFIDNRPTNVLCLLIAVFLVTLVFGDVIFNKASISMFDTANAIGVERQTGVYHPERPLLRPTEGYIDAGGAAFQQEPMQQFMKFILRAKQSPYWNPYEATGSLGPEIAIDNKFSPFTLLVALTGGSSMAFHIILLSLYVIGTYFLILLITRCFKLSLLSAIFASVVYLLNGFSVANIASNVSQTYLYFPILLYALCYFAQKPNYRRFLLLILANIPIFLTTFLPTTILVIASIYIISFGFVLKEYPDWNNRLKVYGFQILSALVCFLLLAFLWLPLFEGAKILGLLEMYNTRIFYEARFKAFLLFFSPKHFWETYSSTPSFDVWNYMYGYIFHFGIITSLVLAQVFNRKNFRNWTVLVIFALLILFFGRIFKLPVLYQIFGVIPVFKDMGEQYLWFVPAITLVLLSAFGMESFNAKNFRIPVWVTYAIISGCILFLTINFAPRANEFIPQFEMLKGYYLLIIFNMAMMFLFISISALVFFHYSRMPQKTTKIKLIIITLAFLELFFYMNTMRVKRMDIFQNPPSYVKFLQTNTGFNRVASFSTTFLPELGSAYQIRVIESQTYAMPWYQKFYERNFQTKNDRWTTFAMVFGQKDNPNIHEQILDMLSVKYIVTDDKRMPKYLNYFKDHGYPIAYQDDICTIFENIDVSPRLITLGALKYAPLTPDTQGYALDKMAFTQDEKFFKEAQSYGIPSEIVSTDAQNSAEIVSEKTTDEIFHVKLSKPSVVALMDDWSPNWKAYANGKEVSIGQINESFRGIALIPGEYTIEMKYTPKSLPVALWISSIVALMIIGSIFLRRKFDRFLQSFIKSDTTKVTTIPIQKISFAVVLPMFNEEDNVKPSIEAINNYLKKIKEKTKIIAVDDGSRDNTLKNLKELKKQIPIIIAQHRNNRGYGVANLTGAKVASEKKFDYVLFMDADLTQDPKYIGLFLPEMRKGVDYIKATRYSLGGGTAGVPFKRRIVSIIGNFLARILIRLPLTDYTNGFRAVKTSIISRVTCNEKGFAYLIEEAVQVSKIAKTYVEIPYILTVRKNNSQSKFRYNPKVYYNYLKYLFRR